MAFTLPLAKAAKTLAAERPTSSLLGPHTMASACGVLALNFIFMIIGLTALHQQEWYECRQWGSIDVSNVDVIGDNYESTVLFLVTGFSIICSAMAFNFGYAFRAAWIRNYLFVALALGFTIILFYVTLVPGKLSCFFRVNCFNEVRHELVSFHLFSSIVVSIYSYFFLFEVSFIRMFYEQLPPNQ